MKKHLFLLTAACGMACGCSQMGEEQGTPGSASRTLCFEAPVMGRATRGGMTATDKYPTDWKFAVWAQWDKESFSAWRAEEADFMNNVECAYDSESVPEDERTWRPENGDGQKTYLWPKNGVLSFLAVSPSDWVIEGASSGEGRNVWAKPTVESGTNKYKGFTSQELTLEQSGKQEDLMYSSLAKDKTFSQSTWPDESGSASTYDGVQIWFNHALARVKFAAVKVSKGMEHVSIVIKSIVLSGVKNQGSFAENADDPDGKPAWTTVDDSEPITYDNVISPNPYAGITGDDEAAIAAIAAVDADESKGYKVTSTDVNNTTDLDGLGALDLLVMPQEIAPETKVTVVYTIKTATGKPIRQTAEVLLQDLFNDEDAAFDVNKQYTFSIFFAMEKIYFSPEVVEWEEANTSWTTQDPEDEDPEDEDPAAEDPAAESE